MFVPRSYCVIWNTRCYWFTGFAIFRLSKTRMKTPLLKFGFWSLSASSETFLFLSRGAKPNKTTLCLFVVITSWYNGLCVRRLQSRPCSQLYAVILENWKHHTVKDFHLTESADSTWACCQTFSPNSWDVYLFDIKGNKLESDLISAVKVSLLCLFRYLSRQATGP